jgi:hypothetical protein
MFCEPVGGSAGALDEICNLAWLAWLGVIQLKISNRFWWLLGVKSWVVVTTIASGDGSPRTKNKPAPVAGGGPVADGFELIQRLQIVLKWRSSDSSFSTPQTIPCTNPLQRGHWCVVFSTTDGWLQYSPAQHSPVSLTTLLMVATSRRCDDRSPTPSPSPVATNKTAFLTTGPSSVSLKLTAPRVLILEFSAMWRCLLWLAIKMSHFLHEKKSFGFRIQSWLPSMFSRRIWPRN